jgi:hypothetical protein
MTKEKKFTNATVLFTNVDINFPNLLTPTGSPLNPDKKSYSVTIPLPKNEKVIVDGKERDIMDLSKELLKRHFGSEAEKVFVKIENDKQKIFMVDGDQVKKKDGTPIEYLKGKYQIKVATGEDAPHIYYDADSRKVTFANTSAWEEEGRKIKQGAVANVAAQIWVQDNKYGFGLRGKLLAVQFVKTGSSGQDVDTEALFSPIEKPAVPVVAFGGTAPSFADEDED